MCKIEDCEKASTRRGMCDTHYRRWMRHGDATVLLRPAKAEGGPCGVQNCLTPASVKGLCRKHDRYQRTFGHPTLRTINCHDCEEPFQYEVRDGTRRMYCDECIRHPERLKPNRNLEAEAAENRRQLMRRYGITPERYEQMLAEQYGICCICGEPPDPNGVRSAARLHVDHDHSTGNVRALLCIRCNQGLGYFRDDPARLTTAAAYLIQHQSANQRSTT